MRVWTHPSKVAGGLGRLPRPEALEHMYTTCIHTHALRLKELLELYTVDFLYPIYIRN